MLALIIIGMLIPSLYRKLWPLPAFFPTVTKGARVAFLEFQSERSSNTGVVQSCVESIQTNVRSDFTHREAFRCDRVMIVVVNQLRLCLTFLQHISNFK